MRYGHGFPAAAAAVVLSAAPPLACADDGSEKESPWEIGIALGYGERTNPLIQSDDIDILVDIDIAWFGERWFFDNGDVGLTLRNDERFTLNVIGRINSDRLFFSKTDTEHVSVFNFGESTLEPIEVPDRDYAFEVGLELLTDGEWGYLQLAAHHDVSDRHHGYELYADYGRRFRRQRWSFEPSFGFSWKSKDLNDYYWGVRVDEANSRLQVYRPDAGLNAHARVAASYQLDRHWTFQAAAEYERLNDEAADSPLVADRSVRSAFAGFSYHF
ncbi:MAG TPA: MipA/OmpV family protein [Gammaproteobacteria bacterium]